MLPGSHFDKKQKQAQQFSQYLRKYSFTLRETKLTAELTWVLKFLYIIKSFWGKLYFAHTVAVEHT